MRAPGPPGDRKQAEAATPADAGGRGAGPQATAAGEGMQPTARLRAALDALLRHRRHWVAGALVLGLVAAGFALAVPQLRARQHFRAAGADLQRYHNPQAIRHLQVCLEVWPTD